MAQYYSEMAREQNDKMQKQNEYASQNAFLMNNPDIKNSDLLDLHNLTVKESVTALKQIMYEKRQRKS